MKHVHDDPHVTRKGHIMFGVFLETAGEMQNILEKFLSTMTEVKFLACF